eukprot:9677390-Alexandrium_andersonii.AAC.1
MVRRRNWHRSGGPCPYRSGGRACLGQVQRVFCNSRSGRGAGGSSCASRPSQHRPIVALPAQAAGRCSEGPPRARRRGLWLKRAPL